MSFWDKLESVRSRWNVLEHPFYQRWSAGELSREDLATYSGQYRHAVVALADAADYASKLAADAGLSDKLAGHAEEERSHIDLWDGFVGAVGGDVGAAPSAETKACVSGWTGEESRRDLLETLTALYAIESGQPEISETKRDGLVRFYGLDSKAATEYFDLHAELDKHHAAAERKLIEQLIGEGDEDRLLAEAEKTFQANWELLDGVERLCGRPVVSATV